MKIRVAFVCWGNICRSTLSESVFTYKVKEKGLSDQFVIDSFATSTEEIGNPPHRGTVNKLKFSPLSYTPYKHWLYRQRCRVVSVFFPIVYYQNCVYRILG